MLELIRKGQLDKFYQEAESILLGIAGTEQFSKTLVSESVLYNKNRLKIPGKQHDLKLELTLDIDRMYQEALLGNKIPISSGGYSYGIKRAESQKVNPVNWAREVIWYGHRNGAYLYGTESMELDIAGHY